MVPLEPSTYQSGSNPAVCLAVRRTTRCVLRVFSTENGPERLFHASADKDRERRCPTDDLQRKSKSTKTRPRVSSSDRALGSA
jgi:hypothetical protein